jgi:hypothetical protein
MGYVLRAGLKPRMQEEFRKEIIYTSGERRFRLSEASRNSSESQNTFRGEE